MSNKVIRLQRAHKGFTMIEVLTVVTAIGILATIGVVSYIGVQKNTRDNQRTSQITIIAEALEKYYDKNGEYPDCLTLSGASSPLKDIDQEVLIAPKSNSSSIKCSEPSATDDAFYYHFNTGNGSWTIEYFNEGQNANVVAVSSRRIVISTPNIAKLTAPILTILSNGTHYIDLGWSPYTPNNSTKFMLKYSTDKDFSTALTHMESPNKTDLSYSMKYLNAGTKYYMSIKAIGDNINYADSDWSDINATTRLEYTLTLNINLSKSGTLTGGGTYEDNSSVNILATALDGYTFSNWTGDDGCSGLASHNLTMNSSKTCTANFKINAPTITSAEENFYTGIDVGRTTNSSTFNASVNCPIGTTAKYEYRKIVQEASNTWNGTPYSRGAITSTWSSMNLGTSYYFGPDGFTTQASIRAQCKSNSNDIASDWSNAHDFTPHTAIVLPPVIDNIVTTYFTTTADNKYTFKIRIETTPSLECNSIIENGEYYYIYPVSRFDLYIDEYNNDYWTPDVRGWYKDRLEGFISTWWINDWIYANNPITLNVHMKDTNTNSYHQFTTGDKYKVMRQIKCYNPYTTISSDISSNEIITSGDLTVP